MFKSGIFEDKNVIVNCSSIIIPYKRTNENYFVGNFWGYSNISAKDVKCNTFHGTTLNLKKNLKPNKYRLVISIVKINKKNYINNFFNRFI